MPGIYFGWHPSPQLWWTVGASPLFERATGLAELLGGALLLLPRTTLLGAVISSANMLFVVLLNMCYDVGRDEIRGGAEGGQGCRLASVERLEVGAAGAAGRVPELAGELVLERPGEELRGRPGHLVREAVPLTSDSVRECCVSAERLGTARQAARFSAIVYL